MHNMCLQSDIGNNGVCEWVGLIRYSIIRKFMARVVSSTTLFWSWRNFHTPVMSFENMAALLLTFSKVQL